MNVREAVPPDGEEIRAVHVDSIAGLGPEAYTREQVDAWAKGCESADYSAAIESEGRQFVVAERDGDVVGFSSLTFESSEEYEADVDAEVTAVYVHPSVVRRGVGSKLYAELERRAREREVQTLGLSASLNAVSFYEHHGYERVREYRHEFSARESTGVEGTVVEMKKEL